MKDSFKRKPAAPKVAPVAPPVVLAAPPRWSLPDVTPTPKAEAKKPESVTPKPNASVVLAELARITKGQK